MNLDDHIWPIHPQRQADELLSSWLVRIAKAFDLKLHTFARVGLPGFEIWTRDIDKNAQPELLELIAKRTGRTLSEVEQATLSSYDDILVAGKIFSGRSQWVMPLGIYHRTHRNNGLTFCPMCLAEDKIPYFRRSWRLAFLVICSKHQIQMYDSCPQCGAAVTFFRHDFKNRYTPQPINIAECYNCHFDLRFAQTIVVKDTTFINFIIDLQNILDSQIALLNGEPIYSFLYFEVIRQLLKLLTLDRYGIKLRKAIENRSGIIMEPFQIEGLQNSFETLPFSVRSNALKLIPWLMQDWPNRFISIVEKSNLTRSRIVRDMGYVPYWFESVIREYFDRSTYRPTHEEINSAFIWLSTNKNNVTKKDLTNSLGFRDSKLVSQFLASK